MTEEATPVVKVSELYQVGIVVRDLKKSIELYEKLLGIGPWDEMCIDGEVLTSMTYKGKPVENASFLTGVAWVGDLQIELIQPVEGDLPYSDFLREHGEGLHHMGHVQVSDMDAAVRDLEAQGYPCIFAGASPGTRFAYIDMTKSLGMIVELLKMG